jgi:predicted DNA-binding transcriptional regulator YafY
MAQDNHARRSQWRVLMRCLSLLRLLLRTPATTSALRQIVIDEAAGCGEHITVQTANERLEKDRARLRDILGCEIAFDYGTGLYSLLAVETPLFDVSEQAVRGLAFLQGNFADPAMPKHNEIKALMDEILRLLPLERQREVRHQRQTLELDIVVLDSDVIDERVWEAIHVACAEKRLLEFDYQARTRADKDTRRHLVEPNGYYLRDGHYYLDAYWLESHGNQTVAQRRWQSFRIGRIAQPLILPTHFAARERRGHAELIYVLSAQIARSGVTARFPNSRVEYHDDGSATVYARSSSLFTDLRVLLRYGPNCKVIGGETAVAEMQKLVRSVYQVYGED